LSQLQIECTGFLGVILIVGTEVLAGLGEQVAAQLAILLGAVLYAGAAIYGRRLSHLSGPVSSLGTMLWACASPPEPAEMGDVGDGVIAACEPFVLGQMRVDDTGQSVGIALVARNGGVVTLGRELLPETRLPEGRPGARHLHHQPLEGAGAGIGGQQAPGLFRQMDQDGA